MNIQDALREASLSGNSISSNTAQMYKQTPKSLLFWVLGDKSTNDVYKTDKLNKILSANDWIEDEE